MMYKIIQVYIISLNNSYATEWLHRREHGVWQRCHETSLDILKLGTPTVHLDYGVLFCIIFVNSNYIFSTRAIQKQ